MEKDVLGKVIDAEKEIQRCIELEKEKVREWLESVKSESEEEFLVEQRKIDTSLEQSLAHARTVAEAKVAEILEIATTDADRLQKLNAEILTGIIGKRIAGILPG